MDRNQLGPFVLLQKLGEGGMGVVYKARDARLDRLVAIKLLPESRVADPDCRARFMQEARAASALNHPGIVTVYDIAEQDGRHYIVMEFVDGKSLHEIITRKRMRITEVLKIAAQIADALTAAHAAGIVHRDLKPGNIMMDSRGRAKVLDFGLAKLTPPFLSTHMTGDKTRTLAKDGPRTEEGVIMGSLAYMSPEQAEGHPVDARSDIFSFGAVLYEMITGQRAFRGQSHAAILAAVVERDPPPPSEVAPGVPPELERVISRCLRKDAARRSQHMSDVRLALEELRDEFASGKVVDAKASAVVSARRRAWLWPAVAAACAVIAAAAVAWSLMHRSPAPSAAQLVRVTPDDGYSYTSPAISPDGKFVAAVSDRSGTQQLWLQQVGGGNPIQVTRSAERVLAAQFFPDGTHLLVWTQADSGSGSIVITPTLGGDPRVILRGKLLWSALSPDGRQVAYIENVGGQLRLAVIPTEGGTPRSIEKWDMTQGHAKPPAGLWMPDGKSLIVYGSKRRDASNLDDWEFFALPLDGGDPSSMGVGDVLRAAGFGSPRFAVAVGDSLLISGGRNERSNVWQVRFTPGSRRVAGSPRQLTFGTEHEFATSVSAGGAVAILSVKDFSDLYLLPIDPTTGNASAPVRRLTQDGRPKILWSIGGDPATMYFEVPEWSGRGFTLVGYALDLATSQQRQLNRGLDLAVTAAVSSDGLWIAYTRPEGIGYSISVGRVGSPQETARPLCSKCGIAPGARFSPDGRYVLFVPDATVTPNSKRKFSVALLELSSGEVRPWLEDPTESIGVYGFFDGDWAVIGTERPGEEESRRLHLAPWRPTPVPRSEWVEFPSPTLSFSPAAPFIYWFQNSRLMAMRFDSTQRRFSEPFPVHMPLGSAVEIRSTDTWSVRGPGIAFARDQSKGSVWLMKLTE
jgi:eukaryotic-like serine/threonine-protein kinase